VSPSARARIVDTADVLGIASCVHRERATAPVPQR
jgi:hypothetical protein